MNKKILDILKLIFFLSLGFFLVWYSIHQIPENELDKFKSALKNANYWLVIPIFFIMTSSHLLRALRWKLLMEPLGYKPSLSNTFFAVMIGYMANFAFPRLGEVLKCTILAKYEHVPAEKNVGTIVAERAFDVICLLLLFLLALILEKDIVVAAYHKMQNLAKPQQTEGSSLFTYIKYGLGICLAVFVIWIIATKKWIAFINKIKSIFKGIGEGVASAWRLKQKKLFLLYSILIWVLYVSGTWIGFYATKGTEVGLNGAIAGLAFASIGMILTPGGIGSYAILLALVLEFYNVPYSLGLANGTLHWFAQFMIVLLVGFICLMLLPVVNKNKSLKT